MKTIFKILGAIGLLIVVAFAGGIGKLVGKSTSERFIDGKRDSELNAVLLQAASQLNENLPMMVDSETRLDSTVGINKQFHYNYTLVNYSAAELDPFELKKTMTPQVSNFVCTSEDMQVFVKNGVTITYVYFGKEGKQVMKISVPPSQCNRS